MRYDIGVVKTCAFVAGISREIRLAPEIHVFLYDRYWRLAKWHEARGHARRARTLKARALHHWAQAGYDEPPPAVALAMPIPLPPLFTDAVARTRPHRFNKRAA